MFSYRRRLVPHHTPPTPSDEYQLVSKQLFELSNWAERLEQSPAEVLEDDRVFSSCAFADHCFV
jgi:hypothetical protein